MTFTTRPEITGTFGVATSTHWIASAVGMRILELGGNAFDAAVAMGLTLNVVEPHLNGPLGDLPALIKPAGSDRPQVVCGQGPAPAGATIDHYRSEGLDLIPGSGLLATVIPGAFDAWMLILREHGTMPLRAVMEPAIQYAERGHPMLARVADTIAEIAPFFREEWPSSAATWLPGDAAPKAGALFHNPDLAATWTTLLAEAETQDGRAAQIDAARDAFYRGFIAEKIDTFLRTACLMDGAGARREGVLTGADMAGYRATIEDPVSVDHHGWTVWKAGFWTQGPVLLQSLNLLDTAGIAAQDPMGAGFVHRVTEALKLAFADREAYYGDPTHTALPQQTLLSKDYSDGRATLIGATASHDQRPGEIAGFEAWAQAARDRYADPVAAMSHPSLQPGDTVHLDVIDRWGQYDFRHAVRGMAAKLPRGAGPRHAAQHARADVLAQGGLAHLPRSGSPPRTTLSPSMARAPDGTELAFGTPGGDQQDQWQLIYLLRLIHGGMTLQEGIDAPLFHTGHLQASFYPRAARPGHLMIEPNNGDAVIADLRARGHDVEVAEPWSIGRLTATARSPGGLLRAAATPRLMQAYAIGR